MNTASLVDQWIEQNGSPRRFPQGDNSDFIAIRSFLEKHGYRVNGHRYHFTISKGREFRRKTDRRGMLQFVDELRIAEGLPPILARAA